MLLYIVLGVLALLFLLAVAQQLTLLHKGKGIPGPSAVVPFIGNLIPMIMTPFKFYEDQEKYGGLSWNSFFGLFVVFSKDTDITRKVFASPQNFELFLTAGAKKILGENNIAFMSGEPHKNLRRQLLPLFQPRALSIYIPLQETVIRKHVAEWVKTAGQQVCQPLTRDLNMETSQNIFVGPYLDKASRDEFADCYWRMNEGFLTVPIAYPGSTLSKALQARERLQDLLAGFAVASRKNVASGKTPECLLDVWMEVEQQSGDRLDPHEIGLHLLDFLFASQDATTSAMTWIMCNLAEMPEVRRRVLEEQDRLRPNDEPLSYEMIEKMKVTHMFVKETLRLRPPATMVPHKALNDTQLTDGYVVPKGAVVLPSIWCAAHEGYTNPEAFDMDRFGPERDEQEQFAKHFLVFGHGPHMCIGRHYAMNHLVAFTSILIKNADWKRIRTKDSDPIIFLPTIFPADKGIVEMTKRNPIVAH